MVASRSERRRQTRNSRMSETNEQKNKELEKIRALPLYECNLTGDNWEQIYNGLLSSDEKALFSSNGNLSNLLKYCVNGNYVHSDGIEYLYDDEYYENEAFNIRKPETPQVYLYLYTTNGLKMRAPAELTKPYLKRVGSGGKVRRKRTLKRKLTNKRRIRRH